MAGPSVDAPSDELVTGGLSMALLPQASDATTSAERIELSALSLLRGAVCPSCCFLLA